MIAFARVTVICAMAIAIPTAVLAKVPCEETLKDVRAVRGSTELKGAEATKVDDLINKGIDRCNADDDDRANGLFKDAMTAMGK